jgi:outer membrane protein assembly factor BamD (BamD/ComL family)
MEAADLFIVMGTETYGKKTSGIIDTYQEMMYIKSSKKPYFLINMNPDSSVMEFKESATNLVFNLNTVSWERWEVGTPMSTKLVGLIKSKLGQCYAPALDLKPAPIAPAFNAAPRAPAFNAAVVPGTMEPPDVGCAPRLTMKLVQATAIHEASDPWTKFVGQAPFVKFVLISKIDGERPAVESEFVHDGGNNPVWPEAAPELHFEVGDDARHQWMLRLQLRNKNLPDEPLIGTVTPDLIVSNITRKLELKVDTGGTLHCQTSFAEGGARSKGGAEEVEVVEGAVQTRTDTMTQEELKQLAKKWTDKITRTDTMTQEELEQLAKKWIKILQHQVSPFLKQGWEQYRQNNWGGAICYFDQAIKADKTSPLELKQAKLLAMYSHIQLGIVCLSRSAYVDAAQHFHQAMQFHEGSDKRMQLVREYHACSLYEAAKQAFDDGNWGGGEDSAEELFEKVLETRALLPKLKIKAANHVERCIQKRRAAKKALRLSGSYLGETNELFEQGKMFLRNGNLKLARQRFKEAQKQGTLPLELDDRIDEYEDTIRKCLRTADGEGTACIFDNNSQLVLPGKTQGGFGTGSLHLGSSTSQLIGVEGKQQGISKEMVAVINTEFPRGKERTKLIAGLTADLRQSLNIIYAKVDVSGMKAGSTIVFFRFVQHREHEESVSLLESEYLRQVEDKDSRLYLKGRSITHLIDAPKTLALTTQIAGTKSAPTLPEVAFAARRKYKVKRQYKVGSIVDMLDVKCRLEKQLGAGASATVFKVSFSAAGRMFPTSALKVYRARSGFKQLCREASIMLDLNWPKPHPNVLRMAFVWYEQRFNDILFLTELVDGGTLQEWINGKLLYTGSMEEQQRRLVSIAHQLSSGLWHLHERGILHQDIKPENVLMTKRGKPVLADFSISAKGTSKGGCVQAKLMGATPIFASPNLSRQFYKA